MGTCRNVQRARQRRRVAAQHFAAVATLAIASLLVAEDSAHAAERIDYPTKPVRMIVAVPSSSGADTITRAVAVRLGERWGAGVIVDNRPGAGGAIAMELVRTAIPDGYTLLSASVGLVSTARLLKKVVFDPATAFEPIVQMTSQPYVLVVPRGVPFGNLSELIAFARARPGVLNYASSGTGSASHLGAELFKSMARVEITHVPYKGLGQAITEMASGQTQVLFVTVVSALPFIKMGRLRAIAAATSHRLSAFPDLPTVAESGLPGFELSSAYALYAPAKTKAAIVDLINRDVSAILEKTEYRAQLTTDGAEVAERNTPAQFRNIFLRELAKWESLIRNSAIAREDLSGSGSNP
jgi:tripartite-type tricarboxylate transporter receptor subunit TctC